MGQFYNAEKMRDIRRKLRQDSTEAEKVLWKQLRGRRLAGVKFRRQYSVGPYVLDFYCPTKRLGIELDGEYHLEEEQKEHDRVREEEINAVGIQIVRFTNDEVFYNLDEVLGRIRKLI